MKLFGRISELTGDILKIYVMYIKIYGTYIQHVINFCL